MGKKIGYRACVRVNNSSFLLGNLLLPGHARAVSMR